MTEADKLKRLNAIIEGANKLPGVYSSHNQGNVVYPQSSDKAG